MASTLASYESGKKRYLAFCAQLNLQPLPVDESRLLHFVAYLFKASLCHQTIKSYLSAVRHLQISMGLPDPSLSSFPRLNYALKGVRRAGPVRRREARLPVTPEVLRAIFQLWSQLPEDYDRLMLWAAFCLGFFGFMQSGEFTCPSLREFSSDMLGPGDVAVDSHTSPSFITVRLKRSKNDPFGVGTTIHLGSTGDPLCPVKAVLGYLARLIYPDTGSLEVFSIHSIH